MRRAGLGEVAAAAALARFDDDGVEAGQAGDLLGAAEAAGLADLGEQVAGQDRADPVDRLQRPAALVGAGEATQLRVDGVQLGFQAAITAKSESTCRRACSGSWSAAAQRSPGGLSRFDREQGQPS